MMRRFLLRLALVLIVGLALYELQKPPPALDEPGLPPAPVADVPALDEPGLPPAPVADVPAVVPEHLPGLADLPDPGAGGRP